MRIDFNRMTPEQLAAFGQGGIPAVEALNSRSMLGAGAGSGPAAPASTLFPNMGVADYAAPPPGYPADTATSPQDFGTRDYAAPPQGYPADFATSPQDFGTRDYAAPPSGSSLLGADLGYGVGSYTDPGSGYNVYPNAVPTGVGPGGSAETVADTGVRDFQFPPSGPIETVADTGVRDFGYPPPDANAMRDQIASLLAQQQPQQMPDMISGSV